MPMGPLYVLIGEVSVQVLYSFFNWVVCLPGVESCEGSELSQLIVRVNYKLFTLIK